MSNETELIVDVDPIEFTNWDIVAQVTAGADKVKKARQGCKSGQIMAKHEGKLARQTGLLIRNPQTGKILRAFVNYATIVTAERVKAQETTEA